MNTLKQKQLVHTTITTTKMDANSLQADCPDLSKSVISTILQNPRYSQTFLRDMQEERRRVENSQQRLVDELQEQFNQLPRQVIETTLHENSYNVEKALVPLLERVEEFRQMNNAPTSSSSEPQYSLQFTLTSSPSVDLNEPIHITWQLDGIEPTKYDWIGLFSVDSNNKKYYSYQWTGKLAQGKLTFPAPNTFGNFELRFFHGSKYYEHLASIPIVVGPVYDVEAGIDGKEIVVKISQRSGSVYSWAWAGLYKKSEKDSTYIQWDWLKNKTELRFSIPNNVTEELEVRVFAASYSRVAVSNPISIL